MLGLLAEGDRSGYDLLKRAERSVAHMWAPAKSQLYAVLPRLVEAVLKVFFAELCSREALLRQLDDYAEVQRGFLADYEAITPATRYGALTLEYGLELMPVRLKWLEKTRRELSR